MYLFRFVNYFLVMEFLEGASKNVVAQGGGLSMIILVGKNTWGKSFVSGVTRERRTAPGDSIQG